MVGRGHFRRTMSAHPLSVIQSLRCFNCRRFAYTDLFKGEYGPCGYICRDCVDLIEGRFK